MTERDNAHEAAQARPVPVVDEDGVPVGETVPARERAAWAEETAWLAPARQGRNPLPQAAKDAAQAAAMLGAMLARHDGTIAA